MGLNKSKGNMYEFVTHTWNAIKGECPHGCTYCYMKRWGNLRQIRLDKKEFREFDRDIKKYGEGLFIFIGSSCDMFADSIPDEWIQQTLNHCRKYDNKYLFQSKNPKGLLNRLNGLDAVACTTIETNRWYPAIMRFSPHPASRAEALSRFNGTRYVTIEPVMDFDLNPLVDFIELCHPEQVNIGGDSGNNGLPEPSIEKVMALIDELSKFTRVSQKRNLDRLLKCR